MKPSKIKTEEIFDQEIYKKAKPHFIIAWNGVKDIGYTVPELINFFHDQFGDKSLPYLKQFVLDIRDGNLHNDKQKQSLSKITQIFDSEMYMDIFIIGGAYFEAGIREYTEWSKAVLDDIDEKYAPYLRGVYEHLRHHPGLDKEEITPFEEIHNIEEKDE